MEKDTPILNGERYPNSLFVNDGKCSLGYIEYDGKGGHYRPDQIARDVAKSDLKLDAPIIHLSPQAYHGGIDYLRWLLLKEASGYCAASVHDYSVFLVTETKDRLATKEILRDCHPLGEGSGKISFVLKYKDHVIGATKWGLPVDKNEDQQSLELRRFFVLDGTPKNTESWFLNKCMIVLEAMGHKRLITYCHELEKASSLLATGWSEIHREHREYDYYIWNSHYFSRRVWWKFAKEAGLITESVKSTEAKLLLAKYLGAAVKYEGIKRKFVKLLSKDPQ